MSLAWADSLSSPRHKRILMLAMSVAVLSATSQMVLAGSGRRNKQQPPQATLDARLGRATEYGDIAKVKALLSSGADASQNVPWGRSRCSALAIAAWSGHCDILRLYLSKQMQVNITDNEGETPLMAAVRGNTVRDNTEAVRILLEQGANLEVRNYRGMTALLIASFPEMGGARPPFKLLSMLINHGANVNAKDKFGRTPLSIAAGTANSEAVGFWLAHKSNVNVADMDGMTPLMQAAYSVELEIGHVCCPDCVEQLIAHGADINATDLDGNTALMLVCRVNAFTKDDAQVEIARTLLEHGANAGATNKRGKTALDIAREEKHHGLVLLLNDAVHHR
jgi:ankyrin repeat protein